MKLFQCNNCSNPIFFENTVCESCHSPLGYLPQDNRVYALVGSPDNGWEIINEPGQRYRYCDNHAYDVCNWLVPAGQATMCPACNLNDTIPNLAIEDNLEAWRKIEYAKHHLIYSLLRLGLPLKSKVEDPESGLGFNFLDDSVDDEAQVLTGHSEGVITLNIDEADPVYREQSREQMDEPYRTLIGHFRHEIGHYYWDILIANNPQALESFRTVFGDERSDYNQSLENYYAASPPNDWNAYFVSAYSAAHPWEDWAETWAHYLHLVDTLETAHSFGVQVKPRIENSDSISMAADFDPYASRDFEAIIDAALPLVFAVNSINRSMGQPDLYPFIVPPTVLEKLRFIHDRIGESTASAG